MKHYFFVLIISTTLFSGCKQSSIDINLLQTSIDSLNKKLDNTYLPGLGEFMSALQVHHAKLWFAAKNKNWPLAQFEIGEINESLEDIKKYCTDRPETKFIPMINEPVDNITGAIKEKNSVKFKTCYVVLTNTCNNCHTATNHAYNLITTPTTPPYSNQNYGGKK